VADATHRATLIEIETLMAAAPYTPEGERLDVESGIGYSSRVVDQTTTDRKVSTLILTHSWQLLDQRQE
jgi:hypothetical protein